VNRLREIVPAHCWELAIPASALGEGHESAVLLRKQRKRIWRHGMTRQVVLDEDIPDGISKDFGLIGSLAVSHFLNMRSRTEARTLEESFGVDFIRTAEHDWEVLSALVCWEYSLTQSAGGDRT